MDIKLTADRIKMVKDMGFDFQFPASKRKRK